jgi:uncharacterized protein YheU (UPF0270 family)
MAAQLFDRLRRTVPAVAVATGLVWAGALAVAPGAAAAPVAVATTPGSISTIAGGVGGPATATAVPLGTFGDSPCGVSYGNGSLNVATGHTIRKVDPQTDWLTTPAGIGSGGPRGNGGPAAKAYLDSCSVVVDHSGNLVIADWINQQVRVVAARTGTFYGKAMTAGDIYRVAGTGSAGFSGNGGPATKAELAQPEGAAVDGAGNLVIADTQNERIRVVAARTGTFYGKSLTAGDIYTVAGNGTLGFSGDRGPATRAALNTPEAVAVDGAGNLVIADASNDRVRVVAVRTGTFYGRSMTAGDIYTGAGGGTTGLGDGGPATSAELCQPKSVALDGAGNLVIADTCDRQVRVVAVRTGTFYGQSMTAGDIYTVAGDGYPGVLGDGGPATRAELWSPTGVAVDGAGNLAIADVWGVRVVATTTNSFYGQAMTAGDIYTVAGNGGRWFSGDGGPATAATVSPACRVAVDGAGNLVIADESDGRVRVVAASTGSFYGQAMTAGNIYTVAGNGQVGFSGDGGPATKARFWGPDAIAIDHSGNLVVGDYFNNRVRVVAAATGSFYGQAMTAGNIYTVAGNGTAGFSGDGGPASSAELHQPEGAAVDGAGNLVIADTSNNRVRVVAVRTGTFYGRSMTAGNIYTVAGGGTAGVGDGGPASKAELRQPVGITVDGAGNLVIADTSNNRVRVVAVRTGTSYGRSMTTGDIYTVAGNGTAGFSGDGGPATSAELSLPTDVAVNGAGNLVIADTQNERVRMVTG